MLKVSNLNVYKKIDDTNKYLIKDISFELENGKNLGIIGKSGAGKSTIGKALIGVLDSNCFIENASISIDGASFNDSFRGKIISMLFQNPNTYLNPSMKVGYQIDEMFMYHYKDSKIVAKEKCLELLKEVGFNEPIKVYNYYPSELSGGMKQKVCLCICLACNPKIIILDEPCTYLDNDSKEKMLSLLKFLQSRHKFSLIYISHDFKEVYKMCDEIMVIKDGKIVEYGNIDEVISNPFHVHTNELLLDYLCFYENIVLPSFSCFPIEDESLSKISNHHYARNISKEDKKEISNKKVKGLIRRAYENIRN